MESYEEMLKKAQADMPEDVGKGERFEIPKARGHIQGNKTIISNFLQIAQTFRRPPEHLLKYVNRELAALGEIKKNVVIFNTKMPASRFNEKVISYADSFIICKTCGKPDTKLSKEAGITILKCQACGSRYSVSSKI